MQVTDNILERKQNESEFKHHKRIIEGKLGDKTLSDYDYSELSKYAYGREYSTDVARRMFYGSKRTLDYLNSNRTESISDEDLLSELDMKLVEIKKERNKLSAEKLEYNRWLREEARDELIAEKICNAITTIPQLKIPKFLPSRSYDSRSFLLSYGDEHVGIEFELRDLFGNIINSYSPEEFERRMWSMFNQVIELVEKEAIDTLHIFSMGDYTDGCLRVSQLMKLRYGVVEGTIYYANFITTWLNELSRYVHIRYQQTGGNHSELRMLGQPKSTFVEDNMSKVVAEFIKVRLKDNPNFIYIDNPSGYMYAELSSNTVMGFHGETRNMEKAIKDFSNIHGVKIQYLLAGHIHHSKSEEVSAGSEVINIPSVIATDPYALSLSKTSDPAAKLMIFEQGRGKVCEYTLKLN